MYKFLVKKGGIDYGVGERESCGTGNGRENKIRLSLLDSLELQEFTVTKGLSFQ